MNEALISATARRDLSRIWHETRARFGERQADRYLRRISDVMATLAQNSELGRACDELGRGLRRHEVNAHILFYRPRPAGIAVVRVLHRHMDVGRHL